MRWLSPYSVEAMPGSTLPALYFRFGLEWITCGRYEIDATFGVGVGVVSEVPSSVRRQR